MPRDDGVFTLETAVGTLRCAYSETLAQGQAVTLIVRPEAIALSDGRSSPRTGANAISGRVSERYFLGNITGYRIACADGLVLQVQGDPWASFSVGDEVCCSFDAAHAWIIPD